LSVSVAASKAAFSFSARSFSAFRQSFPIRSLKGRTAISIIYLKAVFDTSPFAEMGRKRLERNRPLLFLPAAKTTEIDHQMYDTALITEKNLQIYPLFRILPDGYATPSLDY